MDGGRATAIPLTGSAVDAAGAMKMRIAMVRKQVLLMDLMGVIFAIDPKFCPYKRDGERSEWVGWTLRSCAL